MAAEIETLTAALRAPEVATAPVEQFLTLNALCERIGYAQQTIRNLINLRELKVGKHFTQRRAGGKILFIWSAMEGWLRERQLDRSVVEPFIPKHYARPRKIR